MKTKIFGMLIAMIMVLAMFASCNNNSGDSGDNGGNNPPEDPYANVEIPAGAPSYNYSWAKTKIKMELTNNTQSDELSSGCARYYAGTAANAFDDIDTLVRNRNLQAAKQANVELDPSYVANTSEYAWGANITRIASAAITEDSNNPDIYCNFAYDLTCAQLRGAFANLKDTSYANGNFFRFNQAGYNPVGENYFDSKAGEGYFYDYMQSVSLSEDKMYVLASNYCTDLVRAFLVVPVNIQMLNSISADKSWTGDMQDYNDFYDLVWRETDKNAKYAEGWTYDVLAHYASKVYSEINGSETALDDVVGFIAGCNSGLVSSGLLYTSNVKIIDRETYKYPTNNTALEEYAAAITKLFDEGKTNGIITVKGEAATAYDANAKTELQMIRNKFAKNEILFGGVIAVGSLEDTVYQNMRVDGEGFGILPVPAYKSGEEYLTLVHNLARVVVIAKASTEFSQCSAYLDYVSRMSTDVMDTYYNDVLSGKTGGLAAAQNNKMLTYIRNHVRDCFDKTFEDAVANKYEAEVGANAATASKWHEILGNKHEFIYNSFAADYDAQREQKQKNLDQVIAEWNSKT